MAIGSTARATFERQVERALVRYVFTHGQGAQLLFLWVTGTGLFLLVWPSPLHAGLWTALAVALGLLIVREQRAKVGVRRIVAAGVLARRFPAEAVADAELRVAIESSRVLVTELLTMTWGLRRRGDETALAQVIKDAEGLMMVQLESAWQVEEIERLLSLVESERPSAPPRNGGTDGGARPGGAALDAVRAEGEAARANVEQVREQLEELLLSVARLERRPGDLVITAQVTHGAGQTLARLRDVVEARRRAANEVAELFVPIGTQR